MVRHINVFIIYILFIAGCVPPIVHNRTRFVLKDDGYNNQYQQLRTGGYYYSIYDRKPLKGKRGQGIKMKILLNNGYVNNFKNGYGNQCGDSIELTCEFRMSEELLKSYLELPRTKRNASPITLWNWGRYEIKNKSILIQTFYNHFGDYYLLEEEAELLDSTSFRIFKERDYKTGVIKEKNETYHFRSYDVSLMYNKTPKNKVFK